MRRIILLALAASCGDWDGYNANEGDCDNTSPNINPNAAEECGNAIDDNCDGQIDEGCAGAGTGTGTGTGAGTGSTTDCLEMTWWPDADQDGWGGSESIEACEAPPGFIERSGDCDDGDDDIHPGAPEACDGVDNDCDGDVDENLSDAWYADSDGDGYGAGARIDVICDGAHGDLVDNNRDCDDRAAEIHPGADEVCDGLDNDCDGGFDVDAIDAPAWFADDDLDGYGDRAEFVVACERPAGYVEDSTDCDDSARGTYPGAAEVCDEKDNDCDGVVPINEIDNDGDDFTECAGDCDDQNADRFPGNPEVCDGLDNDCSGGIPREEIDNDGDGYVECSEIDPDCDDSDRRIHPGTIWNMDADEDGYGRPGTDLEQCEDPSDEDLRWVVDDEQDCDDGDNDIHPGAEEICDDGEDNDCDGDVDLDDDAC